MTATATTQVQRSEPADGWDGSSTLASVALAAVTVCTAIGFCRIFADWAFLRPMLVVAVGVHLVAAALRWWNVPAWAALPVTAAAGFELLGLAYYRDTLRFGLPSGDTVSLLRVDMRLVWDQFPEATAPVPSSGQWVVAVTLALAICAMLADAFAFRAFGRAEAIVPTGVLFVFTAALGTDRNRIAVAALWLGVAVVAVALLRAAHRDGNAAWLGPPRRRNVVAAVPAMVVCGGLAAAIAAGVAPRLPGAGAEALLDAQSGDEVTEVVSPLVDIRSRLVNRSNVQLFTMQSEQPRYWRLTGLPEFDGTTWSLPETATEPAEGFFGAIGDGDELLPQQLVVNRLGGKLVPAAHAPVATGPGQVLDWSPGPGTLVAPGGLQNGQVLDLLSVAVGPSPEVLRASTATSPPDPIALQLPADFPDDVVQQAREVVASATTQYDQALMLQNWFRDNFTYDLDVQTGHSDDAIRSFLRLRRGYCEQFAGTFAAMARSVGLPARVAVGFTPGELQADGRYHVFGRNAHAWPEVWFDGVGWVSFEPTPGRGEPGAEARTGVPPAQDEGPVDDGDPAPTTTLTPPTTTTPTTPTSVTPTSTVPSPTLAPPIDPRAGGDGGTGWSRPLLLVAIAAAIATWMTAMPAFVRRRAERGATTPAARVVAAWHGAVGAIALAGGHPPPGATPLEYAGSPDVETHVDHRPLEELAERLTAAVYSPDTTDEATALRCEHLRSRIEHAAREVTPWRVRVLARLDPRVARQRVAGA